MDSVDRPIVIDFQRAAGRRRRPPSPVREVVPAGAGAGLLAAPQAPVPQAAAPSELDESRQLDFLIERYLAHHRRRNRSPKTIAWHRGALGDLAGYFAARGWRTDVDDEPKAILAHARAWLDELYSRPSTLGRPYSAESLATKVRSVRAFFGWLSEEDYLPFHYLAKLEKPVVGYRHPKALSDGQLAQLFAARQLQPVDYLGVRNLALVLVFLDTWCRLREIVELDLGDVHLDDGWIKVLGKGNREAIVRLSPQTVEILTHYIDRWRPKPKPGHTRLFLRQNGTNLTAAGVQNMLARIRLATGLPLSAHRLRHTGATAGARKGMPMERIQAKLRHTSPRATVGYIGLAAEINEHQSGLECLNIEIRLPRKPIPQSDRR